MFSQKCKKWTAILMAVVMMMAVLASCGQSSGETAESQAQTESLTETGAEMESETVEETIVETEAPETEAPVEIDYDNLVSDAYSTTASDGYGGEYEYHIPQINLEGDEIQSINDEIYAMLYGYIEIAVAADFVPDYGNTLYSWVVNGDTLSLLIDVSFWPDASGYDVYTVYNISISEAGSMTREEVLEQYGWTTDTFESALEAQLADEWDSIYGDYENMAGISNSEALQTRTDTLSEDNLSSAWAFFNANGEICASCSYYFPVGGGYSQLCLNLETGENFYSLAGTAE